MGWAPRQETRTDIGVQLYNCKLPRVVLLPESAFDPTPIFKVQSTMVLDTTVKATASAEVLDCGNSVSGFSPSPYRRLDGGGRLEVAP